MRTCLLAAVLCLLSQPGMAAEATWPQFRGPGGQGHAPAQQVPLRWSESENIVWKTPLPGQGWSSPVIWGDEIWLTAASTDGHQLRALVVDRQRGQLRRDLLVFTVDQPDLINPKNSYASPTAVLDEQHAYVHYGTFGTACISRATGDILWTNQELRLDHKEGPGSSPVLCGNLLIFHCDGMDVQYIVALDTATGRVVWKTERSGSKDPNPDFRKAYSTPLLITVDGRQQLISTAADHAFAYDPATGREIWNVDYKGFSNVPRPVLGDGLVYLCTGAVRPQLWAVRPTGQGNVTESHVVWQQTELVPAIPSPIYIDGLLMMVNNRGMASCLDAATGQQHWVERMGGNYSASPVYADGRVYFWSEEGKTTVLAPSAQLEVLAENQLDGAFMATPAMLDGAIFARTDTHLYRIEEAGQTVGAE